MDAEQRKRAYQAIVVEGMHPSKDGLIRRLNQEKEKIRHKYHYLSDVFTYCMIYNATGTTIEFVFHKDFHGFFPSDETRRNHKIPNGHWHYFLHTGDRDHTKFGSSGVAVYRAPQKEQGKFCDILCAWQTAFQFKGPQNKSYTEIHEATQYFDWETKRWSTFRAKMDKHKSQNSSENGFGYKSFVKVEGGNTPYNYVGILTLSDIPININ